MPRYKCTAHITVTVDAPDRYAAISRVIDMVNDSDIRELRTTIECVRSR